MSSPVQLELLTGARALLAAHAAALPQRDDLCGAFCGSLALHAAGIREGEAGGIGQDEVALAAGSWLSASPDPSHLPRGERSRRDYRLALPLIEDASLSGTTPAGLTRALEQLSAGQLAALAFSGDWTAATLGGLFDALLRLKRPVTLVANIATCHLWGGAARVDQMLEHLLDGTLEGPPADWDVGHFVCVFARAAGPGGALYGVADTYPALGRRGVHAQPGELLARALARPGMAAGGLIAVVAAEAAPDIRAAAQRLGLREGAWNNGTREPEMSA